MKGVEWTIQWRIMLTLTISQLLYFELESNEGNFIDGTLTFINSFPICRHQQFEMVDWSLLSLLSYVVVTAHIRFYMTSYTDT